MGDLEDSSLLSVGWCLLNTMASLIFLGWSCHTRSMTFVESQLLMWTDSMWYSGKTDDFWYLQNRVLTRIRRCICIHSRHNQFGRWYRRVDPIGFCSLVTLRIGEVNWPSWKLRWPDVSCKPCRCKSCTWAIRASRVRCARLSVQFFDPASSWRWCCTDVLMCVTLQPFGGKENVSRHLDTRSYGSVTIHC